MLAPLLGAFLCACGNEESPPDLVIVDGYEHGVERRRITIPEFFDTSDTRDPRFIPMGASLRAWSQQIYTLPPAPVRDSHSKQPMYIHLHIGGADAKCAEKGLEGATACATVFFGPIFSCYIWVDEEDADWIWGHELQHCIAGSFHE